MHNADVLQVVSRFILFVVIFKGKITQNKCIVHKVRKSILYIVSWVFCLQKYLGKVFGSFDFTFVSLQLYAL